MTIHSGMLIVEKYKSEGLAVSKVKEVCVCVFGRGQRVTTGDLNQGSSWGGQNLILQGCQY